MTDKIHRLAQGTGGYWTGAGATHNEDPFMLGGGGGDGLLLCNAFSCVFKLKGESRQRWSVYHVDSLRKSNFSAGRKQALALPAVSA